MNAINYITFKERFERYSKWTVEELAKELAVRDLQLFENIDIPAPETPITYVTTSTTDAPPEYTTTYSFT
jgi:hypothetical protein